MKALSNKEQMIEYHNFAISNEIMNLRDHFQWILKSLSQTLIGKFFSCFEFQLRSWEQKKGGKEGESVPPWQPH